MQEKKIFFGETWGIPAPSIEDRKSKIDRNDPKSPFSKFIGNDLAIKKLQAAAFDALGNADHLCRELAFALFGPPSTGKTTLAKLFAQTVDLPFINIGPKSVKSLNDFLNICKKILNDKYDLPLHQFDGNRYVLPPCVILIDEVHALSASVVDGLLTATEHDDAQLMTEKGERVNCYNICWMISTTEAGRLFDAFRTRFSPINLKYLSNKEISKIVKLANNDLPVEICELIAKFNSRIPRKALEFARYVKMNKRMNEELSWEYLVKMVARDEGIDEFGMQETHLRVLKSLSKGPVSKAQMINIIGVKLEELENVIMPWLMADTSDSPPLIKTSSKGYILTDQGKCELKKRNAL